MVSDCVSSSVSTLGRVSQGGRQRRLSHDTDASGRDDARDPPDLVPASITVCACRRHDVCIHRRHQADRYHVLHHPSRPFARHP